MELKPGYKMTEVGVIPEDWDCLRACEFGFFKGGSGFPLWAQGQRTGEYPFFKVSDMNNEGNETFMTAANHYVSEQTRKHLGAQVFPADSIVFAKVGAAVFLERKKILGQPSCIDNNMAAYVLDASRADVRFVHSMLLMKKLGALVATTALPALNGKQLGEMVLALPPLPEQRAIAQALSDVDALLATLDKIIAKKRDLKQAVMQQLLTGKTRLPGFNGEWIERKLFELANFFDNFRIPVMESKREIGITPYYGANGIQGYIKGYTHDGEFVLFAEDGANDLNNYPVHYVNGKIWVNNHAHVIQAIHNKATTKYLSYALKKIDFIQVLVGGTRAKLNGSAAKVIKILIPSDIDEQTAIAEILSEIDTELSAFEARRDKVCQLKQAMMQELFTGKTRLI